jgi:hypothetical protein
MVLSPGIPSGPLCEVRDLLCYFLFGLLPPTVFAFSELGYSDWMLFCMFYSWCDDEVMGGPPGLSRFCCPVWLVAAIVLNCLVLLCKPGAVTTPHRKTIPNWITNKSISNSWMGITRQLIVVEMLSIICIITLNNLTRLQLPIRQGSRIYSILEVHPLPHHHTSYKTCKTAFNQNSLIQKMQKQ